MKPSVAVETRAVEKDRLTRCGGLHALRVSGRLKSGMIRSLGRLRRVAVGPRGTAVLTRTEIGLLLVPSGDRRWGESLSFDGRYDF